MRLYTNAGEANKKGAVPPVSRILHVLIPKDVGKIIEGKIIKEICFILILLEKTILLGSEIFFITKATEFLVY